MTDTSQDLEPELLAQTVVSALKQAQTQGGRGDWTREIKQCLANAVPTEPCHLYVYGHGFTLRNSGGEWLYDLCWLLYDGEGDKANVVSMPLAMECEWGSDIPILEDFQKLLVSRAGLRVMIFGEENKDTRETMSMLVKQIRVYQGSSPRDRYLLAGYDKGGFECRLYDGKGNELTRYE